MNTKHLQCLAILTRTAFAAATLFAIGRPSTAQAEQSLLKLTVSLDSPATITQGEPIVLRYHITNPQDSAMIGLEKPQGQDWLTEKLVDATGHAVSPVVQFDPQSFAGGFQVALQTFPVAALSTYEGYKVINQEFAVPTPGRYTLTVRATLMSGSSAEVVGTGDTSTLTETFSFPLVVTSSDRSRLALVAQALSSAILKGPNTDQPDLQKRFMQIRSLFVMPDAVAAPFWVQVAEGHVDVSDELYRAHTAAAADALASIATNRSLPQEETAPYLLWMDRMYDTGNGGLKQHIASLYSYYGLAEPGRRIKPVVTN